MILKSLTILIARGSKLITSFFDLDKPYASVKLGNTGVVNDIILHFE